MQAMTHSDNRGRRSSVRPDLYLEGLAREVGISSGHLSKILRGKVNPSIPVVRKLAAAMKVGVERLLNELERERLKAERLKAEKAKADRAKANGKRKANGGGR